MTKLNLVEQVVKAWNKASQLEPPVEPPKLVFYMPATPPSGLLRIVEKALWRCRRRWLFKRHVIPLLAHEDAVEKATGYRREDILWANRLPLKIDAVEALKRRNKLAANSNR